MRRVAVIILLAGLLQCSGAFAQDSGPTDADLKSAYCLSVIRDRDSLTQVCAQASSIPSLAEAHKQQCHQDQSNIERLKDYLAARGYLFGERDPTPALLAGNRGSADFKDCVYAAQHQTPEEEACNKKCLAQRDVRDAMTCFDEACPIPDSCRRLRTCNDLSFLPF